MKNELLKLTSFVQLLGKVEGGKRIHEMLYILECEGVNFGLYHFKYGTSGPVADGLDIRIHQLVSSEVLIENTSSDNTCSYIYTKNSKYLQHEEVDPEILSRARLIYFLNGLPVYYLALLATIYFLKKEKSYPTDEIVKTKVEILLPKWINEIEQAFVIYDEIRSGIIDLNIKTLA